MKGMQKMQENRTIILNKTPIRTSKNYGINDVELENDVLPKNLGDFNNLNITGNMDNFEIMKNTNKDKLKYGVGLNLEKNKNLEIKCKNSGVLKLEFNFNSSNINLTENIFINAEKKAKIRIIVKYVGNENLKFFHNGIIKIVANDEAYVDVVVVNLLNNLSYNFLSIENLLNEKSNVNYTIVDFGGKASITNWYSNLKGQDCNSNINTIYLGKDEQLFDINYISEIYGKNSCTNIEVQGALKDKSAKNFKGTIDFKRGCKKSKGNENEFCMLLSNNAKSKALPMLLCTEEDVEGNHSTASGKVDEKLLFYIMSRGISFKEATQLIVKSKFNKILANIKDEKLLDEISSEIDKRLN